MTKRLTNPLTDPLLDLDPLTNSPTSLLTPALTNSSPALSMESSPSPATNPTTSPTKNPLPSSAANTTANPSTNPTTSPSPASSKAGRLKQRYAFVTGADRGVGLALVKLLLEQGFTVFAGQFMPGLQELSALQRQYGDALFPVPLDIAEDDSVRKAAAQVNAVTDRLDVLLNVAAILGDISATVLDRLDFAEMQQVYNVNALGPLRVSNALMGHLLRGEGKLLVNVSSEAGSIQNSGRDAWFAYCMSKAALNMQSKLIFNGISREGGKVLVVHPGWVRTFMRGELDAEGELSAEESAAAVWTLAEERLRPEYTQAELVLLDYRGRPMPW